MVDSHGKTGFRIFGSKVVSLLGAKKLASKRGKASSTCWMIYDNIIYLRRKKT